jgi:AraC family transcriptional regulator
MTERRGRRSVLVEAGTLAVLPRDEPYAHRFDETARCFMVQLGAEWAERMRVLGAAEPATPAYLRRSKANAIATELYTEFRAGDDASRLVIEGYMLALLGELARAGARSARSDGRGERSPRPPWLVRATERLHAHLDDAIDADGGGVSMAAIAAEVGVHPVHLARTFREHHGTTMGEYLRRLRVERARAQLAVTAKPLSQIALEAGFADQAHFTRVFRTVVGATPGAYRRAAATAGPSAQPMAMAR